MQQLQQYILAFAMIVCGATYATARSAIVFRLPNKRGLVRNFIPTPTIEGVSDAIKLL